MNIPSIAPSQTRVCSVCHALESVAMEMHDHHLVKRSHGGTETALLCAKCHNEVHARGWQVATTHDYLYVLDAEAHLLVKHWFTPAGFDEGLLIQQLEAAPMKLREASVNFRFLSDEALKAAAEALSALEETNWYCLAHLFREAILRTPYGDKTEKLEAIAASFDLKRRAAYKYIAALEVLEEHPELEEVHGDAQLPSPDALLLIASAGDVDKAIERYEVLAAAGPLSMTQFREDLRQERDTLAPPPEYHKCPLCEQPHVIRSGLASMGRERK